MTRWIQNIAMLGLIAAFLLPGLGFALNVTRGMGAVSETEKRVLAGLPSFETDAKTYTTEFDNFLEDNFGFRMMMIRVARKVRDNLGENPPSVAVGQDQWLFLNSAAYRDEFEGAGDWDEAHVTRWIQSLSDMKEALGARSIPFAAFIAVDKIRTYPEYAPADWTEGDRRLRTSIYNHPDVSQTGLVDVEPMVLSAKERGKQTFYLRDTHWTSDGTYDAAMTILDQLDPELSRPRFLPGPPIEQRTTALKDLEAISGFETSQEPPHMMIEFPPTKPGFLTYLTLLEDGTPDLGQFSTIRISGTETAPEGTLVIIGDSFADTMMPHFRPSYSEIIRIHHGAHFKDVHLDEVLSYNPDAVLFGTAERQALRKQRPMAQLDEVSETE